MNTSATFLEDWQLSQIISIHKSARKEDIHNYRLTSKIPYISKLIEYIISNKIFPQINKWLSNSQHGFHADRFTVINLALLCNNVFNNFANRLQMDVV